LGSNGGANGGARGDDDDDEGADDDGMVIACAISLIIDDGDCASMISLWYDNNLLTLLGKSAGNMNTSHQDERSGGKPRNGRATHMVGRSNKSRPYLVIQMIAMLPNE
jgi:hypothetical protein